MTLEPDRRSLPGIGHHGYPLARPPAQKLARTGGALHLQASSQFTDSAAAAGLRALEKRVESVPVAVYEFLQAGGVPAAVTIITSEPVAPELRDAAISLLSAVARKQPQAMSLAFTEAKGMAAVVHLLGRGIQPRGGALTEEGAATMAAAARLLEAALNAGGQAAGGAFGAAGGFTALRTALACGQLSGQHATEVAGRAVGLLHRLVWAGNKSFAGPQHAAVCAAVCSARTHQPLLALIYTNSHVDAAVKGMEVLRALAAASSACMHALMQSNCIDTCLTVLDRANLNSNSNLRTALLAALLLHDALDWDRACRADILAKGGVSTCLNVLIRTPSEDAPIADVVNSLLSSLAEGSDDVTHQDGKRLLHWAVQFGEIEALETILDGHPNLEARDERGNTALHLAAAAGHMAPVRLLLDAGADATARNFAGALPHQLAVEGSPLWASLLAELDWRACLEQPRPCQYAATEGDACCSEDWHGPAKCFFLPLSGRVRVESAGVPSPSSKHWFLSAISGHRSKAAQPDQHTTTQQAGQLLHEFKLPPVCNIAALDDLTLSLDFRHGFASATASGHGQFTPEGEGAAGSVGVGEVIERGDEPKGGGRVGRLVIRVDSPPDQRAPDLAHAIRSLLHRCYPASQVVTTISEAASRAPGNADGHLYHENGSGVNSASAMSPRSTLSHFLSSAEAIQAKRAGSEQLLTPQSRPDMRGSAAPSPSLLQLEGHELDAAGRREEAASSCPETERHAPESVGESEGEVHPAWPGTIEGELGEGVAGPSHPPSQAVEPSQRQVSARSAPGQRRPSSALEIARRLRRTPVSKSGADSADARAGNMSDAKLGSHAGRQDGPESPSASASVSAESGAASSGLGVPADVNLQDGTASSSIGKSGPGRGQGDGKVQSEEDSAAEHVCQALCDAHTTLQSDQNNGASDPPAAAAKGSPANAEHQHEALLVGEQKERSQHRREQEPCFKYGDGARVAMEGTAVADAPKTSSDRAAVKAQHTMSYLPLAENQQRSRKPKAPPPPPPPPPLLRNYGPAATVDPTATAAAVRAADEYRRQQQALGRGKLYASTAQSVADKVRELELQIGLVQQLNSQGLRKEEPPVAHGAKSALPPEVAHTSGEDSAASGELCTVEERTLKTDEQEDGLEAESTAEEGTPGARVTERGTGDEQADGLEAESAPRQGTPGAPGEQPFKTAAAVAMHSAPTCSAARHTRVDAAAVSPVHGTHPSASSSSNATGNMEVDSSVSGTRLSASTSDNADGSTTAESSVSASASTSAEQATRRKSVRKPFYYGPRNTAPEQLQPSAAAAGASAQCEAMPSRQAAESEALQPSRQAKPKRKPFAYGPRPSALDASKAEPAATPVERLGRSAQTIPWLEEKVAAAKTTSGVTASAMQSSTPAGAIFVNGGPIASTMGQSSTPAAIPRGSTGPSETPQRSPRDSVTTEQESSASRTGDTTATELLHSSAADAAPLHRGRSTSVRKPFAYGPRKQEASENMAPNRGLSEVGGEGGSGQGWSADPRFIRG